MRRVRTAASTVAAIVLASCGPGVTSTPPEPQTSAPLASGAGDISALSRVQQELMAPQPGRFPTTFRHDAPDADSVLMEFTANYWNRDANDTVELLRVDDGISSHAVTLHLGSGQWLYRYRVDGRWEVDRFADELVGAENSMLNSLVRIGAPIADSVPVDPEAAGTVEVIELESELLGRTIPYVLYTPRRPSEEPLRILVLLHGFGQPATDWAEAVGIGHFMDNLLADGRIEPFAIVMPSGENTNYSGNRGLHIVDEVIPDAEARLGMIGGSAPYAVGGFSQGGAGSLRLASLRPDDFGLALPIAMAGPCGGLCASPLYDDAYPDGLSATVATWVGVDDELGLDVEHDRFAEYAERRGIEHEDIRSDSLGHRRSGHSIRYVRSIAVEMLMRVDEFFAAS